MEINILLENASVVVVEVDEVISKDAGDVETAVVVDSIMDDEVVVITTILMALGMVVVTTTVTMVVVDFVVDASDAEIAAIINNVVITIRVTTTMMTAKIIAIRQNSSRSFVIKSNSYNKTRTKIRIRTTR